jgi:HEPN domain-containing protein
MGNRAKDWMTQAEGDLNHARNSLRAGDFDWSCFAAQQSAEKAVKGLILSLGGEGGGHSILRLLKDLSEMLSVPDDLVKAAMRLDKHYIPTRYPNGFDAGAPKEYFTEEEAQKAIEDAGRIYDFCSQSLSRP